MYSIEIANTIFLVRKIVNTHKPRSSSFPDCHRTLNNSSLGHRLDHSWFEIVLVFQIYCNHYGIMSPCSEVCPCLIFLQITLSCWYFKSIYLSTDGDALKNQLISILDSQRRSEERRRDGVSEIITSFLVPDVFIYWCLQY